MGREHWREKPFCKACLWRRLHLWAHPRAPKPRKTLRVAISPTRNDGRHGLCSFSRPRPWALLFKKSTKTFFSFSFSFGINVCKTNSFIIITLRSLNQTLEFRVWHFLRGRASLTSAGPSAEICGSGSQLWCSGIPQACRTLCQANAQEGYQFRTLSIQSTWRGEEK